MNEPLAMERFQRIQHLQQHCTALLLIFEVTAWLSFPVRGHVIDKQAHYQNMPRIVGQCSEPIVLAYISCILHGQQHLIFPFEHLLGGTFLFNLERHNLLVSQIFCRVDAGKSSLANNFDDSPLIVQRFPFFKITNFRAALGV